ncbi:hypothetical protein ACFQ0G_38740 [Streptomyces chiangmaiensis]
MANEPSGGQGLVLSQGADGAGGGGGRTGDGGAHDLFGEPLGAAGAVAVADGGELFGGQRAVGEQTAPLGFPQHRDPVDGFAAVVQRS